MSWHTFILQDEFKQAKQIKQAVFFSLLSACAKKKQHPPDKALITLIKHSLQQEQPCYIKYAEPYDQRSNDSPDRFIVWCINQQHEHTWGGLIRLNRAHICEMAKQPWTAGCTCHAEEYTECLWSFVRDAAENSKSRTNRCSSSKERVSLLEACSTLKVCVIESCKNVL